MEFYLSIDGDKQGPFTIFKVAELLRTDVVTAETLGWHRDLDSWKPLREISALEAFLVPTLPEPEPEPEPESELEPIDESDSGEIGPPPVPSDAPPVSLPVRSVRPFTRFWARMFDYTIVSVIVFLASDVVFPEPQPGESFSDLLARYLEQAQQPEARALARTQFLAMIGWHVLEALLIHYFGTTPGKALFGIRVYNPEGTQIPILRSLGRSFYTYVLGVGFYQIPFILIGMTFSFFRLMATGNCLWDQHLKIRVETKPLSVVRIVLAISAFFGLLLLQSIKFS